ncbi:MAG: DUF4249 domain-containing protein [Cyclobacteriaceae bacterium]
MRRVNFFVLMIFFGACVDPLAIEVPDSASDEIVVDGFISDEPGPYTVILTRSLGVTENLRNATPFSAREVSISDNLGNTERLTELELGFYQTSVSGIRGVPGRSYQLSIVTRDGKTYESTPQLMAPAGNIDTLYYEFESTQPLDGPTESGFRIFLDAESPGGSDKYFRWKFSGTYQVETYPQLHDVPCGQSRCPAPRPCSGFIVANGLTAVAPCECCICWVKQMETSPKVSDNQFVSDGKFNRVEVGFVPVTEWTFYTKYLVEVKQLSLSRDAFDYWRLVQAQSEGASSLFQPPFGQPKTNIHPTNGGNPVQGIFYASSITEKRMFISRDDVPVNIPVPSVNIPEDCNIAFDFSTSNQPAEWN